MKADRILVVMNGEIIEEGSHEELMHSKGKYHSLWSKQIFVKPADERARSRSPHKRDVDIIDDLTPSRHRKELAKVSKTTVSEEPSQTNGKQDVEQKSDKGKRPESGHVREVS